GRLAEVADRGAASVIKAAAGDGHRPEVGDPRAHPSETRIGEEGFKTRAEGTPADGEIALVVDAAARRPRTVFVKGAARDGHGPLVLDGAPGTHRGETHTVLEDVAVSKVVEENAVVDEHCAGVIDGAALSPIAVLVGVGRVSAEVTVLQRQGADVHD